MNARFYLSAALGLALAAPVNAGIQPSFNVSEAAWEATDIAVIDRSGKVLETWRGELRPGDRLPRDSWNTADQPTLPSPRPEGDRELIVGARLIVFLVKDGKQGWRVRATEAMLTPAGKKDLRAYVEAACRIKQDFRKAAAEADPIRRAEAMLAFIDLPISQPYWEAQRVWEGCGKAALPVLHGLLADETRRDQSWVILDTLARAGGKAAIPVLEQLLRDEKVFWNNLGMNLDEPAKLPGKRADYLTALLRQLAVLGYNDPSGVVKEVHDQFLDHPILRDHGRSVNADGCMAECPVIDAAQAILSRR